VTATPPTTPKPRRRWLTLPGLLVAAGTMVCVATGCGFAGRLWWVFDLFSHFRLQYFLSISLALVLSLPARRFRASTAFGLCAAINLACLLPYYLPNKPTTSDRSAVLRVISINVHTANEHFDLVKQFLRDHDPDVILLMEVNAAWIKALEEIRPIYPYQQAEPREDNFGMVLCSKLPFTTCATIFLGQAGVPSLVGELDLDGRRLTILGTHPPPPISAEYSAFRNGQLDEVANYLMSVSGPKILVGDLNMSPWSYYFGRLLRRTNLRDSSRGRGIQPTWPTRSMWLRIPIDFCLVSEEITIGSKTIGTDIGSDHFPLMVDVALAKD
jgi:endonuclease/exonuclease/phosphatase (EEP) superfamily protein YafD